MLKSAAATVRQVSSEGLGLIAKVGDTVAEGGEMLARGLHAAAASMEDAAAGLPYPVRERAQSIAAGVRMVGNQVSATFMAPFPSTTPSINFQAAIAAGTDTAFLTVGAVSSLIPGVHWIGSGATAAYGLSRFIPGVLAHIADREDAQSRQGLEAGKLILSTAVAAALLPPVVAAGVYGGALTVTARNAETLLKH